MPKPVVLGANTHMSMSSIDTYPPNVLAQNMIPPVVQTKRNASNSDDDISSAAPHHASSDDELPVTPKQVKKPAVNSKLTVTTHPFELLLTLIQRLLLKRRPLKPSRHPPRRSLRTPAARRPRSRSRSRRMRRQTAMKFKNTT